MTEITATAAEVAAIGVDRSMLIVEDDKALRSRLARALEQRGFIVEQAETVLEAQAMVGKGAPAYAVVDMRLGDGNGLDVIEAIRAKRDDTKSIVLTGYGNIATAVTAVKLGAVDYLSKPADADEIVSALLRAPDAKAPPPPENPMSADAVR
jgi:two-component system, response regulator RegA